jgi:AraC-like DNA-binding protein
MRPAIRTASLTGYAALARSLGLDPAALMAGVGLDLADLDCPDRWVPAAPAARLLELSARESEYQDFALRLATLRGLGALGPLSVALRDEPDLRSLLQLLIRYEDAYTGVLDLRLTENGGLATVQVWLRFGEPVPLGQALDLTTAILVGIIRLLVRSDWTPLATHFSHAAPADPAPYQRLFGPRVLFDQPFTGVVFPARDLDAPVRTSDATVRPYSHQFLRTVIGPRTSTPAAEAAQAVEILLPQGRASRDEVSRYLGLSPQTLRRQLAADGETFSSILTTTRVQLAERYLADHHLSLTEISQLLGFAAPSAFSRWFRQRFRTTPTEWRRAAEPGAARPAAGARTVPEG